MEKKYDNIYNKEEQFKDTLFKSNSHGLDKSIRSNDMYQVPSIKTWILTNFTSLVTWVDTDGIPMPTRYDANVFPSRKYGYGVFIIKAYTIPPNSQYLLNNISHLISNLDIDIREKDIKQIEDDIAEVTSKTIGRSNFTMRFITFIPKDDLDNNTIVIGNNFKASYKIDNLYSHYSDTVRSCIVDDTIKPKVIRGNVSDNKKVIVEVEYHGMENTNLHIAGEPIRIENNKNSNTYLIVNVKDTDGVTIKSKFVSKHELGLLGFLSDDTYSIDKAINQYTDYQIELSNLLAIKTKAMSDWRKYLIEQEISLHKLNAYAVNQLTAELKLEKEEVSAFKDAIKYLKDILL